jgi:DNA replication protein DnaC
MLQNNTIEKLQEMKLSVMAKSFRNQLEDSAAAELSFDDKFSMLVDAEWTARKNNRMKRLMKKADFEYPGASIEDIDYREDRRLDKALITRLATCAYVDEHHNIILLGAAGCGKPICQTPSA